MRRGSRILFIAVMLVAVGLVAWVLFKPGEPEPVYKGKPLSYWLEGFGPAVSTRAGVSGQAQAPSYYEAKIALAAIGTNAVPNLVRMLPWRDSQLKITILSWLMRHHLMKSRNVAGNYNLKAARGLIWLGPTASNAVPQLIRIFERDQSAFAQSTVPGILGSIGPDAAAAVPVLLKRGITHTNAIVRANSIYALRIIFPDAQLVLSALIKCLNDPDPVVRGQAARAVGRYGAAARAAVPQLVQLFEDDPRGPMPVGLISENGPTYISTWGPTPISSVGSLPSLQGLALTALRSIDPEAAAKAELKRAVRHAK